MSRTTFLIVTGLIFLLSCKSEPDNDTPALSSLPVASKSGGESNLFVAADGTAYLSWVEYQDDTTDALVFSKLTTAGWSPPMEIARGSNWFVNWADFPSLVSYSGNKDALVAHWLQKSAHGTYDYDIHISQSTDGGKTWQPSFILHRDSVQAEHGFVSMVPVDDNRIFATWLDGRNTKSGTDGDGDHGHGHGGPMTLRAATFDVQGNLYDEVELDNKVCDCCQTSAVGTPDGTLVAYRNRSDEENRDIFYVKNKNGEWTAPRAVYADNWNIAGCPVNGPALASDGHTVALAWYTAANGNPKVNVAFSSDAGDNFGSPVNIDGGNPEGRVDVVMLNKNEALVSWLERTDTRAEIRAVVISTDGKKGHEHLIATTIPSRSSGFPRMIKSKDKVLFSWTEITDAEMETTRVRSAYFPL